MQTIFIKCILVYVQGQITPQGQFKVVRKGFCQSFKISEGSFAFLILYKIVHDFIYVF